MIDRMMIAVRRLVACLAMLLPFEAMAGNVSTPRTAESPRSEAGNGDCDGKPCTTPPPPLPSWNAALEQFGLLLPKLPAMPSACRQPRQYRSVSQDKLQRQPCYFA